MKCTIPEISWHNRDPVLSVDIQPGTKNENFERLATGGTDSHVVIWYVEVLESGAAKVEVAADLQRHQRAVNVVRFSPSGEFLASGDDESVIIIWKQKTDQDAPELPLGDNDNLMKEQWLGVKVLRGHMEDVYDLSWSPDSLNLISGSVDNSAILWDIQKGRNIGILKEHKGFVQGVTWDPKNQYVATLSSDRMCRIYNVNSKKLVNRISKSQLPVPDNSVLHGKVVRLFHDDTLKSFFRRLCFSPDGQLLIVPSGIIENPDSDKHTNATFIFTRHILNRPAVYLPSNKQYTVAVRCCPLLFELRDRESVFALPYRMIFAVATQNSVILYDTQQPQPFGIVSNIHYTRLTDLTWSADGRLLIVSSTDGYCSIITFAAEELGVVYKPKENEVETSNIEKDEKITDNEIVTVTISEKNERIPTQPIASDIPKTEEAIPASVNSASESDIVNTNANENVTKSDVLDKPPSNDGCDKMGKSSVNSPCQSEKRQRYVHLEKTPEASKIERNDSSGSKYTQHKTPRRITPILLSSPKKLIAKSQPFDACEDDVLLVKTPTKTSLTVQTKTNDMNSKSNEDITIETNSDKASERLFSNTSEDLNEAGPSNNCIEMSAKPETDSNNESGRNNVINSSDSDLVQDGVTTESSATNEEKLKDKEIDNLIETSQIETETSSHEMMQIDTGNETSEDTEDNASKLQVSHEHYVGSSQSVEPECMETDDTTVTKDIHVPKLETVGMNKNPSSPVLQQHSTPPAQDKRTPRRVQFITLSSPKSKKKLL
ncbi:hypothetical protein ANN_11534 [Periplaneta americana]|uniref:CAF1B/HIR1 beta-propeller domain-containing protein n=1 Tax=Periplaneta americana TaxID=6978 RepID=A0ABQ8T6Q2_PERAM|nr:hypothetical protein ANN_11534 [Periplaneta americana]